MKVDIQKLHTWNIIIRLIFMLLVLGVVGLVIYKIIIEDEIATLAGKVAKVDNLKKTYSKNMSDVANLPHIQKEVADLQDTLNSYLKYLPSDVEMPKLVKDTAKTAADNTVSFDTFTPMKDIKEKKTYYITKPIDSTYTVNFNKISGFMQGIAALERIVNVESFTMKSSDLKNAVTDDSLKVKMQLRTYIFSKEVNK